MHMSEMFLGLDLGSVSDPTALVVLERTPLSDGSAITKSHRGPRLFNYQCIHIERYQLGTSYTQIVEQVADLLQQSRLVDQPHLAIDATGVGRPVVDMLINAKLPVRYRPITITGGARDARRDWWNSSQGPQGIQPRRGPLAFWVPKVDLVGAVQAALSSGRLKITAWLPQAKLLRAELLNFKVKISDAGREQFGAWREGQHDDLVLACALAVWLGDETDYAPQELGQAVEVMPPQKEPFAYRYGIRPKGEENAKENRDPFWGHDLITVPGMDIEAFNIQPVKTTRRFYGR